VATRGTIGSQTPSDRRTAFVQFGEPVRQRACGRARRNLRAARIEDAPGDSRGPHEALGQLLDLARTHESEALRVGMRGEGQQAPRSEPPARAEKKRARLRVPRLVPVI